MKRASAVAAAVLVALSLAPGAPHARADVNPPASRPAIPPPGRDTPVGTCRLFDQTIADLGVDGGSAFYVCTTPAQRRYARSECEFYVALNKMIRSVAKHLNADAAASARKTMGDSDDYTDTTVDADGNSASLQRPNSQPMQMTLVDNQWRFSMPDWFATHSPEEITLTRLYFEKAADALDATRERIEAGTLKTQEQIEQQLLKIRSNQ